MNLHKRLNSLSSEKRLDILAYAPNILANDGLARVEQIQKLKDLLADLQFIEAKIFELGVQALISDFFLPPVFNDPKLSEIQHLLNKKGHLFDQCESLDELISTLQTQVAPIPELINSLSAREPYLPPYYLAARHPKSSITDNSESYLKHTLIADSSYGVAISPNDDWIIYGIGNLLKVWSLKAEKELFTLAGHSELIEDCAISPNCDYFVSASADRTLIVWDTKTGEQIKTLRGHQDRVTSCVVSSDGKLIVSASYDGTLRVWNYHTGTEKLSISRFDPSENSLLLFENTSNCCAVSPDGKLVASGEPKGLKVWNIKTGVEEAFLPLGRFPNSCQFITNKLLIISDSFTVRIWNVQEEKARLVLNQDDVVWDCAITPDTRFIVAVSFNHLKIWDANTGTLITKLFNNTGGMTSCSTISQSNKFVSSGFNTVKVWEVPFNDLSYALAPPHSMAISCCTSSSFGDYVVTGTVPTETTRSLVPQVAIWNPKTGTEFFTILIKSEEVVGKKKQDEQEFFLARQYRKSQNFDPNHIFHLQYLPLSIIDINYDNWFHGQDVAPSCFAISVDGSTIVIGLYGDYLHTYHARINHNQVKYVFILPDINDCAIFPSGDFVLSVSQNGKLKIWDMSTGHEKFSYQAHEKSITTCAISPKGDFVVTGSEDHTLKIWDLKGTLRMTLSGHTDCVTDCTISPDGNFVISASRDKSLRVWSTHTGLEIQQLLGHSNQIENCEICPLGHHVFSVSPRVLKVWELKSGKCIASLRFDDYVSTCTVMPDGRNIVVGGNNLHWIQLREKQANFSPPQYQVQLEAKQINNHDHFLYFNKDILDHVRFLNPRERVKPTIVNYIKHKFDIELQKSPGDWLLFLNNTGVHLGLLGELEQAHNYLSRAYEKTSIDNIHHIERGIILSNLGNLYQILDNLPDAQLYQEQALRQFENTESTLWIARVERYLGSILYDLNDFSAALNHYQKSMTSFHQIGHWEDEKSLMAIIAYLRMKIGNKEEAVQDLKKLLQKMK